ncbi:hypothetical protein DFH09DRAFT_1103120 [Mycena vulgaris]|nr:hypothetical protein DFH09DRAFT_1103120 [Mycena vulgaris]
MACARHFIHDEQGHLPRGFSTSYNHKPLYKRLNRVNQRAGKRDIMICSDFINSKRCTLSARSPYFGVELKELVGVVLAAMSDRPISEGNSWKTSQAREEDSYRMHLSKARGIRTSHSKILAGAKPAEWLAKPTQWLASRNAGRGRVMPPKSTPTPETSQSARAQAIFASQKGERSSAKLSVVDYKDPVIYLRLHKNQGSVGLVGLGAWTLLAIKRGRDEQKRTQKSSSPLERWVEIVKGRWGTHLTINTNLDEGL